MKLIKYHTSLDDILVNENYATIAQTSSNIMRKIYSSGVIGLPDVDDLGQCKRYAFELNNNVNYIVSIYDCKDEIAVIDADTTLLPKEKIISDLLDYCGLTPQDAGVFSM